MQFLEIARKSLMEEFRELRGCSSENLLYIKEDLIIPHDMTFHYLIETKARGKSGPVRWHASVLCVSTLRPRVLAIIVVSLPAAQPVFRVNP